MGKFDDEEEPAPPSRRKIVPLRQYTYPIAWVDRAQLNLDSHPIIKGLIEEGNLCTVYGEPGCGKSFFTMDMAQHVALGERWRGRRVRKSLVVYVASEAGASILKRFVAWRDNRLGDSYDDIPLVVLTRGPDLGNLVEHERLAEQLEILQTESGYPLGLVIFDTLSRSMPGSDENSAEDMTKAVACADLIRDKYKAAVIFIHHCGKDPDKGMRGHSSLHGACDVELFVEKGLATVRKVRDGIGGERFGFALEPVELGTDADGDPVMTCLLNWSDSAAPRKDRQPSARNQKIIYGPLRELAHEKGERSPGTSITPKGAITLSVAAVTAHVLPRFGEDTPGYRAREKVKDALMGLQAAGFIGMHGDLLWIIG